jgi:two-component system chemotaxis sensor kinase CheA
VRLTVADDGSGIDEERIREVAVARGLATAESVRGLTRREVMNLIFVPGFSTARQVTSLSGRGVGMDVVKNNIAALSGIIDLHTERGVGTRFEITLPITLAIIRALVVRSSGRTYAVPLNSVLEILEVRGAEIRALSTREAITLRGATLPITRLNRFFAAGEQPPPEPMFVVVTGLAQERLGLAVDEVVGQQDIVVKPLGSLLSGIRGIAGATDLGQRSTVLVLDVGAIIEDVVTGEPVPEAAG